MKSDIQLKYDVLAELCWQPSLSSANIKVTAKNGVVTLTGTVDSFSKRIAAENAIRKVEGIKALAIAIEVNRPPESAVADEEIAEAVSNIFRWNENIPAEKIRVSVSRGIVKLEGEVEWEYQRNFTVESVAHVRGVHSVLNLITIRPAVHAADVEHGIMNAFERSARIDACKIHVEVDGHTVTLSGRVKSLAEKEDAISAAWQAPGIQEVVGNLTIDLPESIYEAEL